MVTQQAAVFYAGMGAFSIGVLALIPFKPVKNGLNQFKNGLNQLRAMLKPRRPMQLYGTLGADTKTDGIASVLEKVFSSVTEKVINALTGLVEALPKLLDHIDRFLNKDMRLKVGFALIFIGIFLIGIARDWPR